MLENRKSLLVKLDRLRRFAPAQINIPDVIQRDAFAPRDMIILMTKSGEIIAVPPDWATIDWDILCPLCEYTCAG